MTGKILGVLSSDIGIDLGTANTLVHVKDHGIVLREPSVVAVRTGTREVLATGGDAKRMLGRTPDGIESVRPLREGVVSDFELTESMLRHFVGQVRRRRTLFRPRTVIAVPPGATEIEKSAVVEAARAVGARETHLIEEPLAAAIGMGLPIEEAAAHFVVDVGAGTTDASVLSLSGIVRSRSVRAAGDALDEAIACYMRRAHHLLVGGRTAEEMKIRIGSAVPLEEELSAEVKGRDLVTGLPRTVKIASEEVREAMEEPLDAIVGAARAVLEQCPPELASDLVDRGLVLVGGGALLRGLDRRISDGTGLPVHVADDPLSAVAAGTGKVLGNRSALRRLAIPKR